MATSNFRASSHSARLVAYTSDSHHLEDVQLTRAARAKTTVRRLSDPLVMRSSTRSSCNSAKASEPSYQLVPWSMAYPSCPIAQPARNATLRNRTHAGSPNCPSYPCSSACLEHVHVEQVLGEHDEKLRELLRPLVSFTQCSGHTISIAALIDHRSSIGVVGSGSRLSGMADDEARVGSR